MGERHRIGLREVRKLAPGQIVWDSAVPAFGARRQKGEAVNYVLFYRTNEGRQRWVTIGRHGAPWTPDMAREEAKRLLGEVVKGGDPAAAKSAKRNAATVADLCEQYFAEAEAGRLLTRRQTSKKASTLATDRGRIDRHIIPLLGRLSVAAVTREDIDAFMHAVADGKTAGKTKTAKKHGLARVSGGKGTATRTVGLLGAIFGYAVRRRMRPDNPVHGTVRFADGRRERRLSDDEYEGLGDALRLGEGASVWPAALAAVRFLALTGWRSGEALGCAGPKSTWRAAPRRSRTRRRASRSGRSRARPATCCADFSRTGDLVFPAARGEAPHDRLSETLGAHCETRRPARRRDAARFAPQLRVARERSRLFRADDRGACRTQGADDHVAICS